MKKYKKTGLIYRITNLETGKYYIGSTYKTAEKRFQEHIKEAFTRRKTAIHKNIYSYGVKNFKIEEIVSCIGSRDEMFIIEDSMIDSHNSMKPNGYNLVYANRGQGSREHIRQAMIEEWKDPVKRAARMLAFSNRKTDPIIEAAALKNRTEQANTPERLKMASEHSLNLWESGQMDHCAELSKIRWADPVFHADAVKKMIEAAEHRMKPIVSVSTFTSEVRFFDSLSDANRHKFYRPNVKDCLNGKTKTAFGFCWFEKVTDDEQYYKDETINLMGKFKTEFTVPIIRTCRKTGATKTYANVKEAGLDGFPVKAVNPVLKKTAKTPHFRGFDWDYVPQ